jgi:hypothetical protein
MTARSRDPRAIGAPHEESGTSMKINVCNKIQDPILVASLEGEPGGDA